MPKQSKLAPERVEWTDEVNKAKALRIRGYTWDQIADLTNYSGGGAVWNAVNNLLQKQQAEGVAELRAIENERLDVAIHAIWDKVKDGDLQAIDRLIRLSERRAKMNGLDMPIGLTLYPPGDDDGVPN